MPDREALLLMQHKLRDLRATWLQQAAHRFNDAELEPDLQAAAVIKHAATTLYNCASELEPLIGEVPITGSDNQQSNTDAEVR